MSKHGQNANFYTPMDNLFVSGEDTCADSLVLLKTWVIVCPRKSTFRMDALR